MSKVGFGEAEIYNQFMRLKNMDYGLFSLCFFSLTGEPTQGRASL